MKFLILTICVTLFLVAISQCSRDVENTKYKKGDIVYLKPDSIKAVIVEINWRNWREPYDVKTGEKITWCSTNEGNISEEMIYGK